MTVQWVAFHVTDRCQLNCDHCLRDPHLKATDIDLSIFTSVLDQARALYNCQHVCMTGGEPTLRADIISLIASLNAIDGIEEIAMTTNGHTLAALALPMAQAGLDRVNISIDTVDPEQFTRLTRGGSLRRVLDGIEAARAAGLTPIKLNAVILADQNDDEVFDLVDYASRTPHDTELRFIEYMPFDQRLFKTVKAADLRTRLSTRYTLDSLPHNTPNGGPARTMQIGETGLKIGFIFHG